MDFELNRERAGLWKAAAMTVFVPQSCDRCRLLRELRLLSLRATDFRSTKGHRTTPSAGVYRSAWRLNPTLSGSPQRGRRLILLPLLRRLFSPVQCGQTRRSVSDHGCGAARYQERSNAAACPLERREFGRTMPSTPEATHPTRLPSISKTRSRSEPSRAAGVLRPFRGPVPVRV